MSKLDALIQQYCPNGVEWVELTLPKDANIYARQYMLCLPDKEVLQAKLREWIQEAEE